MLIDEARTPLILSAQSQSEEQVKVCRQALFLAGQLREGTDFILHPRERQLELLDRAEKRLTEIAEPLGGLWTGERRRRELVTQALTAKHLFLRDKQYLVRDDKIQIIDEHTGRARDGRPCLGARFASDDRDQGERRADQQPRDARAHQLSAILSPLPEVGRHERNARGGAW